jgi:hypothetical protein
MHWSRWTGRYGRHGLIAGRAGGIGHLHGCDEGCFSLGRVTIVLSGVTNFGVNATTYYERLHIIGGKHVAHYWHSSRHHDNYVPLTVTRPEDASPAPGRVARAAWLIVSPRPIVDWGGSLAGEPAPAPRSFRPPCLVERPSLAECFGLRGPTPQAVSCRERSRQPQGRISRAVGHAQVLGAMRRSLSASTTRDSGHDARAAAAAWPGSSGKIKRRPVIAPGLRCHPPASTSREQMIK